MEIEATKPASLLTEPVKNCSVALVFIVDLKVVASMDQDLDRVGIISGGSIYLIWNVLMGALSRLWGYHHNAGLCRGRQSKGTSQYSREFCRVRGRSTRQTGETINQIKTLTGRGANVRETFDRAPFAAD